MIALICLSSFNNRSLCYLGILTYQGIGTGLVHSMHAMTRRSIHFLTTFCRSDPWINPDLLSMALVERTVSVRAYDPLPYV